MHSRRLLPGYALGLAALSLCGTASANGLYPTQFFATLNAPAAIVSADINGDGHLDLVVIGQDQTIAVLIGKADGTFKSPTAYYVAGLVPAALAVADVNGDGKLDIVVANKSDDTVSVLLGNGDGTFKAQTAVQASNGKGTAAPTYKVGQGPISLAIADLNGDGKPDLIVANFTDNNVGVLLGNGDGTFKAQTTLDVGGGPSFVAVADMNNDGKPDLVVSSSTGNYFGVLLGNGDGTFQTETTTKLGPISLNAVLQSLVVADFNHDGNFDVITTTSDLNGQTSLYFGGDGKGGFRTGRTLVTGHQTTYLATADVDGDGNLDLIAGSFSDGTLRVMFGNGVGGFSSGIDYPAIGISSALGVQAFVAGDFNSDGRPDIAAINPNGSLIQVLYNDKHGHFHLNNSYITGTTPTDVQTADLNGDHHLDLVNVNSADGTMDVRLGNGDGTFQPAQTYPVGKNPQRLFLADVNHDGKPDAVTVNLGDGTVSVLLGNGDGTFQSARHFDAGPNPIDIGLGDMDQDGDLDIVVANQVVNTVSILRGNGDGTFKPRISYPAGNTINALAVGDIDHDGFPDVVTVGNFITVLRNDGTGALKQPVFTKSGSVDVYPGIGVRVMLKDVNEDGNLDLLVLDYSDSLLGVLLGNHQGFFTRPGQTYPTCANPNSVAVADLNADGHLDLAVTCEVGNAVAVMLGNGTGAFLEFAYPAEVEPRGVVIGDFDEDDTPDLAVVNGVSDNLNVQLQIHGAVAKDHAPVAVNQPFSIPDGALPQVGVFEATDVDNDDIVFVVVQQPLSVPTGTETSESAGIVTTAPDGVFTYLADTGFTGIAVMKFQATDGIKLSNIGQVTVSVQKNTAGSGYKSKHGFLGAFWLPWLPLLGLFAALRRRRQS
jgi:hypothetical protein